MEKELVLLELNQDEINEIDGGNIYFWAAGAVWAIHQAAYNAGEALGEAYKNYKKNN